MCVPMARCIALGIQGQPGEQFGIGRPIDCPIPPSPSLPVMRYCAIVHCGLISSLTTHIPVEHYLDWSALSSATGTLIRKRLPSGVAAYRRNNSDDSAWPRLALHAQSGPCGRHCARTPPAGFRSRRHVRAWYRSHDHRAHAAFAGLGADPVMRDGLLRAHHARFQTCYTFQIAPDVLRLVKPAWVKLKHGSFTCRRRRMGRRWLRVSHPRASGSGTCSTRPAVRQGPPAGRQPQKGAKQDVSRFHH
jgi:hypothetical protein